MIKQESKRSGVHQGKNLRLLRHSRGVTQGALADLVKMFQTDISDMELQEVIEDQVKLEKVVTVLGGSMEFIRTFDTDSFGKTVTLSNNTYTATPDKDSTGAILQGQGDGVGIEEQNNYYSVSMDDIKELHNQVVAEKDKMINQLKKELREVKAELKELRKSR